METFNITREGANTPQEGGKYSVGTVTRSEHKVSKPLKGEIGGIGIRTPRVGGQGGMGGISQKIGKSVRKPRVGE